MVATHFVFIFLATLTLSVAAFNNSIFLIRHGEKPSNDGLGLSTDGKERAECLVGVMGPSSFFNIGYILAQKPKENGKRKRPLDTVTPLARSLDLKVDTSCDRDDSDCVAKAVKTFAKKHDSNILICWEHKALLDIQKSLGVKNREKYPKKSFDLIYTIQDKKLISKTSENCTGLDN